MTLIIPLKVCVWLYKIYTVHRLYSAYTAFGVSFLKQDLKIPILDLFVEGKSLEEVEAEDKEEEEEAKNIQKRLVAHLSEEDYDLNLLQVHLQP